MNFKMMKEVLTEAGKYSPQMSIQEFEREYQKLAKEKEEKEVANVSLDKKIKYFYSWEKFVSLFGEKLSREALSLVNFRNIATEKGYVNENYPERCGYDHIRDGYGNVEVAHRGASSFHRTERKMLHYYLTPYDYQNLEHKKMIEFIINKVYPSLLKKFKVDIYSIDNGSMDEIYVHVGEKTLYVPLKALMNKDIEAIKKRNVEYQNDYYHNEKYCDDIFSHKDFNCFCNILNK